VRSGTVAVVMLEDTRLGDSQKVRLASAPNKKTKRLTVN
jgi:hypothetical protein